jgi:hypothetical protein
MTAEQRAMEPPRKPAASRLADFGLWAAILVPLHAAGINTIVGYSVAHHACNVNKKGALLSIPLIDLLLTIASAALAATLYARFRSADEVQPENGRRLFMAKLGLLLSGLCMLVILGGLCATLLISPCD